MPSETCHSHAPVKSLTRVLSLRLDTSTRILPEVKELTPSSPTEDPEPAGRSSLRPQTLLPRTALSAMRSSPVFSSMRHDSAQDRLLTYSTQATQPYSMVR